MDWLLATYSPPLSVIAGALGLAIVYWLCTRRYRGRFKGSAPVKAARQVAFYSGVALALVALASPLDLLADDYLFSAHMLQHELLILGVAPLLLAGTPGWLLRDLLASVHLTGFVRWARHPLIAFFGFNLIFSLAHLSSVYELTLASEPLHALEHVIFIVTAMLMWMPVMSPVPDIAPPYPALGQVLYLFLQTIPASLVGALLAATGTAYYATYVLAPRVTALNPVEDQQLGGLLMWVGGGVYFLIATGVVFFTWASREEAADRRPGIPQGVS
ncbi:MAG: cytochrome c oxidase assembly protein [Chloroflexi bacterium]|nr:cytochrome c oxidase assembly protein [Chloroflexota bacterium]MBV9603257.1 cytochrome c oxidase assembly protein [Chloroflexota bacterium]